MIFNDIRITPRPSRTTASTLRTAARASACAPDLGRGVGNSFRSAPAKKSAIPRRGALCHFRSGTFRSRTKTLADETRKRSRAVPSRKTTRVSFSSRRERHTRARATAGLKRFDHGRHGPRTRAPQAVRGAEVPREGILRLCVRARFSARRTSRVVNLFGPVLAFHDAGDIAREDRASRRSPSARAGDKGCAARAATFTASDAPIAFPAAPGHRACRVSGRVSVPGRREPPPGEQPPSCLVTQIRAFFFVSGRDRRSTREARTARSAGGVCCVLRPATDRRPAPIATRTTFVPTATASAA